MESVKGMKTRKILSLLLALLVLFVISFSSFYIAVEANHECDGHDCPVCFCIRQCEAVISVFSEGHVKAACAILAFLFFAFALKVTFSSSVKETPVSRKVRMNN